jgi:hypothetical protein
MKRFLIAALAFGAALPGLPGAALAQDSAGDKVNQLIVYGDDPCPQSEDGAITVCARKDESERFRIPQVLRGDPTAIENEAWSQRVQAYETVGAGGTKSCSPVGPGGATGCMEQLIGKAYAEKAGADDVQMGKLIEAEREKRLSTIDSEADAEQKRVEVLEKQYEEKLKREAEGDPAAAPK